MNMSDRKGASDSGWGEGILKDSRGGRMSSLEKTLLASQYIGQDYPWGKITLWGHRCGPQCIFYLVSSLLFSLRHDCIVHLDVARYPAMSNLRTK